MRMSDEEVERGMGTPARGTATEEESQQVAELEDYFDAKLEAEVRQAAESLATSIRWSKEQLTVIKAAAAKFGVPYQTYVKDSAFRRAIQDLADTQRIGI